MIEILQENNMGNESTAVESANNSKSSNITENGELFDYDKLFMSDEDDKLNNIENDVLLAKKRKSRVISSGSEDNDKDCLSEKNNFENRSKNIDTNKIDELDHEESVPKKKPFKLIDSDSDSSRNSQSDKENNSKQTNIRKAFKLIDSDSEPPVTEDPNPQKVKVKKLKKKKERNQSNVAQKNNSSNSDSDDETDSEKSSNQIKSKLNICDVESSMSGSGSHTSNDEGNNHETMIKDPVKRPPKRMSAKEAENQMKEIQSCSQKFAREANIDIPYHKPKQYSLKEFLSRRNVVKPTAIISSKPDLKKKTVLAIKMSREELELYAKQIEQRQQEALEFFKSEVKPSSDKAPKKEKVSETNGPTNEICMEINTHTEGVDPNAKTNYNSSQLNAHNEIDDSNVAMTSNESSGSIIIESKKINKEMDVELQTEVGSTKLNSDEDVKDMKEDINHECSAELKNDHVHTDELTIENSQTHSDIIDKDINCQIKPMLTEDPLQKLSLNNSEETSLNHNKNMQIDEEIELNSEEKLIENETSSKSCTKQQIDYDLLNFDKKSEKITLKGNPDSLIDLETGNVVAKKSSGPEELFQRFLKHKKKVAHKDTEKMSLFSTNSGKVNLDVITVHVHDDEDMIKESAPGSAYVKLKKSLEEKIAEDRRKECLKRLQDLDKERKEELEEFSDCGYDDGEDNDEEDEESAYIKTREINEDEEEFVESGDNDVDEVDDKTKNPFIDSEADEEDDGKCHQEKVDDDNEIEKENTSEYSSSSSSEEEVENTENNKKPRKSRIITAFEDSEDENEGNKDYHAPQPHPLTLNKSISDLFKSQESLDSPNKNIQDCQNVQNFLIPSLRFDQTQSTELNQPIEDELFGLCSGQFGATQTQQNSSNNLFTQSNTQVDTNDLMALCSGTFETQIESSITPSLEKDPDEFASREVLKTIFQSSDEEVDDDHQNNEKLEKLKKSRKKKRKNLIQDDDEDESDDNDEVSDKENVANEISEDNEENYIDEDVDHCVDYDSEENEIEVKMTKAVKEKFTKSNFIENEAELSESEWGSADEDEKDLDKYDMELGDADEIDSTKVQQELERMHVRRQIDQDLREVKAIQDMLFDEEEDGADRERKFRWKNVDNLFNPEDGRRTLEDDQNPASDEENEEIWRKMRHERNLVLQSEENLSQQLSITSTITSINKSIGGSGPKRRLTIVKSKQSLSQTDAQEKKDSPFLISKSAPILSTSRSSFLLRDNKILERLASATKSMNDSEEGGAIKTVTKGKNYVFATISPSVENPSTKRKIEDPPNDESGAKKKKITRTDNSKSKKQLLLDHLN